MSYRYARTRGAERIHFVQVSKRWRTASRQHCSIKKFGTIPISRCTTIRRMSSLPESHDLLPKSSPNSVRASPVSEEVSFKEENIPAFVQPELRPDPRWCRGSGRNQGLA